MTDQLVITIFPALNGDSILAKFNEASILIDSGYADTYQKYLKPALAKLSSEGRSLTLFVITHIDRDHISGGIKFLAENLVQPIVSIDNIWHNSYRHLVPLATSSVVDGYGEKAVESLPVKSILKEEYVQEKEISAEQGSSLASLIQKGKYDWNRQFNGRAVCLENGLFVKLSALISIRILSPNFDKLTSLYKFWKKELYKLGYKVGDSQKTFDDAFEFIVASEKANRCIVDKDISSTKVELSALASTVSPEDDRVSNGSSMAFWIEWKNRRALFLGDAHPSLIVKSLRTAFKDEDFPIKFDLIKIGHHGSMQNTSIELLELIDSEHYIISTNGKIFNHPDIETIAKIVTRKSDFKRTIYFNYPTEVSSLLNDTLHMTKFNYGVVIGDGKKAIDLVL